MTKAKNTVIFLITSELSTESGAEMVAGHTMGVQRTAQIMRLREPKADQYILDGPDTVLVVEITDE